ncbi:MAG: hypothetical protein ABI858_12395, partial [Pseudoxanthomonas sp.]
MTDLARAKHVLLLVAGLLLASAACAQDAPPGSPRAYLQRMDTDGNGRVSVDEYLVYMGRGFANMDRDNNGVLEGDELPPRARRISLAEHQSSLRAAFRRQDANHDGFLDVA